MLCRKTKAGLSDRKVEQLSIIQQGVELANQINKAFLDYFVT